MSFPICETTCGARSPGPEGPQGPQGPPGPEGGGELGFAEILTEISTGSSDYIGTGLIATIDVPEDQTVIAEVAGTLGSDGPVIAFMALSVDGNPPNPNIFASSYIDVSRPQSFSLIQRIVLTTGQHTIELMWRSSNNTTIYSGFGLAMVVR